jgi:hypothetical protein
MINIFASILTFIVLMVTSVTWASPVPDTGQAKCFDFTVKMRFVQLLYWFLPIQKYGKDKRHMFSKKMQK